jgi:Ca2+-binding EF-hand superfamily protein
LLNEQGELNELLEGAIEDIYYRFDTMISNSIDYDEFKEIYETIGQTINQ